MDCRALSPSSLPHASKLIHDYVENFSRLQNFYKALTAIESARELSLSGIEAVPIFWMATEDHDIDEIRHTTWFYEGKLHRLVLHAAGYLWQRLRQAFREAFFPSRLDSSRSAESQPPRHRRSHPSPGSRTAGRIERCAPPARQGS